MALKISLIRAICFDVDGTLSDTDDRFVQRIAAGLGIIAPLLPRRDPLSLARWLVMATASPGNVLLYNLPDRLGIDDELARLGDYIYRLGLGRSDRPFTLIPGVEEMLPALAARYPLAIISVRGQRNTERFLLQFGLDPYFRCIVSGQTCSHTKPFPEPVLWVAKKLGIAPQECLMVGDTTSDIRAGKDAGAQTVGVLCGFGSQRELASAGADLILSSTAQIQDVLA